MKNIKRFIDFKNNEAALPEVEQNIESDTIVLNPEKPIDIPNTNIGSVETQTKTEMEIEANLQEKLAKQKGLKQLAIPDNHIS